MPQASLNNTRWIGFKSCRIWSRSKQSQQKLWIGVGHHQRVRALAGGRCWGFAIVVDIQGCVIHSRACGNTPIVNNCVVHNNLGCCSLDHHNRIIICLVLKGRWLLSSEFGQRCQVQSRARCWLQLVGCATLLMDASNFGGPDGVRESGVEPRRSLRKARAS